MEFTGERYMPAVVGPSDEMRVEHVHRYLSVRRLVEGKVVVDAACGEGYGSAILARHAARVIGIDVSTEAVEHARVAYRSPNLEFFEGSVGALPLEAHSADVVISFETIEHVDAPTQEMFLAEIRRVLKPEGVLVMSTPDKRTYSDSPGAHNQFHVQEFYRDEFRDFLSRGFSKVVFYDQRHTLSSLLRNDATDRVELLSVDDGEARPPGKYIVAVCSQNEHAIDLSSFIDDEFHFLRDKVRHIANLEGMVTELRAGLQLARDQLRQKEGQAASLERSLAEAQPVLEQARKDLKLQARHIDNLRRFNVELTEAQDRQRHLLALKANHIRNLEAMLAELRAGPTHPRTKPKRRAGNGGTREVVARASGKVSRPRAPVGRPRRTR